MLAVKGSVNKKEQARALRELNNNISRQLGRLSEPNRGESKGKAPVVIRLDNWSSTKPDTKEEN